MDHTRLFTNGALPTLTAIGALWAAPSSAYAWLKICNGTTKPLQYAHKINEPSCGQAHPWRDRGWWNINPGQCTTVYSGDMSSEARPTSGARPLRPRGPAND
jgi:uncharacterized membrane protein